MSMLPASLCSAYAAAGVQVCDAGAVTGRPSSTVVPLLRLAGAGVAARYIADDVRAALASRNVAAVARDVARRADDKTAAMHCAPAVPVYCSALALVIGAGTDADADADANADADSVPAVLTSYEAAHAAQTLLEVLRGVKTTPAGVATDAVLANYAEIVARRTSSFERLVARQLAPHVEALRAGVRGGLASVASSAGGRAAELLRAHAVDMLRLLECTLAVLLGVPAALREQLLTPREAVVAEASASASASASAPATERAARCAEQTLACARKRLVLVRMRAGMSAADAAATLTPALETELLGAPLSGAAEGAVEDALAYMFYGIAAV